MKRTSAIFLILSLLLLCNWDAWSSERVPFYEGARGLAMGGAQIGVVDDETALLVNPAGLGKLRDFYGTILDPEIDVSNNLNGMYQRKAFSNPFSVGSIEPALAKSPGDYYHARAELFPSFVARNFGIGIYTNYILNGEMNSAGTALNMQYRNDLALALGYNFRFFDGRVKLGFDSKLINRIEMNNSNISPSGPFDLQSLGAAEGTGLSTDVGLMLTAPWDWLPSITGVVKDIGDTAFNKASGLRMSTANEPNSVKQEIDVAVSMFPIVSNHVRTSWTLEYDDVTHNTGETDYAKLMHAGVEFNIGDVLFLRAGYNERYFTGGFEISSERFQYQLTTYGEEVGTQTAPQQDRRTVFKVAYRF